MACTFCNADVYVKVVRHTMPLCAPLTKVEEIRQQLISLTGEEYVQLDNLYCPMCGDEVRRGCA